jgi:hypothetical protein
MPHAHGQDQIEDSGLWENRRDVSTPFIRSLLFYAFCRLNIGIHQGTPEHNDTWLGRNAFNSERL